MSVLSSAEFDTRARTGKLHLLLDPPSSCTVPVNVTRRAILNVASPPRATPERFTQYLESFESMALDKYRRIGPGREIAVTAEDVRAWRRTGLAGAMSLTNDQSF